MELVFQLFLAFLGALSLMILILWALWRDVPAQGSGSSGVFGVPSECFEGRHDWRYIGSPALARQCRIAACGKVEYLREESIPDGFKEHCENIRSGAIWHQIDGEIVPVQEIKMECCFHGVPLTVKCNRCEQDFPSKVEP